MRLIFMKDINFLLNKLKDQTEEKIVSPYKEDIEEVKSQIEMINNLLENLKNSNKKDDSSEE